MNTLVDLLNYGQSYWLDNLTRKKINSGELKKRVTEQGLRGITSNPSIFYKAITGSNDYDEQIKELVSQGFTAQQVYDALTIADVQHACDILKPVFDSSEGTDGFVSLEVSPYLARDTERSISEARRLYHAVDRKNCYIKIPGTKEGIPAIEQLLYEGININITLLFSVDRYVEVAQAYVSAVRRRVAEGKSVVNIVSVASFFLSRIDVLTDSLLSQYTFSGGSSEPELLLGKVAIASAKLAYAQFKAIFGSPEWQALAEKGAHVQRPLWASTSTKDPMYDDLMYVEALVGADTVNTLPDDTINALADHGKLRQNAIEEEVDKAPLVFEALQKAGIDIRFVTWQLENEGVKKFVESYDQLMAALEDKRVSMLGDDISTQVASYGSLKKEMEAAYASLDEKHVASRLYAKDPYLWKTDAPTAKLIKESMGWITIPDSYDDIVKELTTFSEKIKDEGYKYTVLLGMGGSSLCSEVARKTYGTASGYLELIVLDNTDTAAIKDVEASIDMEHTLFIAASKSGGTAETISFFKYFYAQMQQKGMADPGKNFVAITDPGSPLVKMAEEYKFRATFLNDTEIGGRYSVLSDFGLLPMALMGVDIDALLQSAQQMHISSGAAVPVASNPGISLGVIMGICAKHGRDKVTFVLSASIGSFGYWAEQLLAESTGKEGKGLIPVNGEELGAPDVYGPDRLFVHMYLPADDNSADEQKLKALETAGHPVVRIKVKSKIALGGEYYRWELATAIAGMVIGIDPFDQPNVAESKQNTNNLLKEWAQNESFKYIEPLMEVDGFSIYGSKEVAQIKDNEHIGAVMASFESLAKPGDYIAVLPYFLMTEARSNILQQWRMSIRNHLKNATTLLNGPRYLHSTGQLHKGGPDTGLYIILVGEETEELPIPGEQYGFATLHTAQSLGDYRSLEDKGRRVIRIDLGKDIDGCLAKLWSLIKKTGAVHSANRS
ncbi:bifunctional transaldolase/phosoglucose isomerase [Taibaiella soli]|uniref:Transaldolase n=1 Tax=Taibaiella soli TaxID=1649169 RepID=A0A2W2B8S2_9BACT|nr:bifunctional transaldolase/phosoglucose isomerase [Taibaiella soli]PZF72689.1 transaldolase [Taibaiella soli]